MVRLKGFQKLTDVDEAKQRWLDILRVGKGKEVKVPIEEALNRVLAVDIIAEEDLPRFDKSAVDGYALKAEDTTGASQFNPVVFCLTGSESIASKETKQVLSAPIRLRKFFHKICGIRL